MDDTNGFFLYGKCAEESCKIENELRLSHNSFHRVVNIPASFTKNIGKEKTKRERKRERGSERESGRERKIRREREERAINTKI